VLLCTAYVNLVSMIPHQLAYQQNDPAILGHPQYSGPFSTMSEISESGLELLSPLFCSDMPKLTEIFFYAEPSGLFERLAPREVSLRDSSIFGSICRRVYCPVL
jgi:hypothetical protein